MSQVRPGHGDRHDRRAAGAGAEGHRARRDGPGGRDRDPRVLLRAPARAAGRCVPDVPGRARGHPEAAGRLHAHRAGRHGRAHRSHVEARRRRPERDARVHPRQPPARLPGLRQGRRVPAAGPHLPLRPRLDAHGLPEAHVREADPDLTADRARPRALHPLLPLHALQRAGRRRRPVGRGQPRLAVDDRDVRGRALPRALLGQHHGDLPGRRAHLDAVPLRGAPLGDPERADRLRAVPGRLQHQRDHTRGPGQAHPVADPSRGRRGLAVRQGPVRLRAPAGRPTASPRRSRSRARATSSPSAGTTPWTRSSGCSARAAPRP